MTFASREDAGRRLGRYLKEQGAHADLVLGLPRGGVIVAAEVAHNLELPFDVLIVRKIGHPLHREFAVGAMAENGVVLLEERGLAKNTLIGAQLDQIIEEEKATLRTYQERLRNEHLDLNGNTVVLVDDGLATGWT